MRGEGACGFSNEWTYCQNEEGDEVQALVALAILRDLIRSQAQVGRNET